MRVYPDVVIGPIGRKILAIAERYPKADQLYVTSAYRDESGSHHNGLSWDGSPTAALDFGAYDDPEPNSVDQANMRDFAKWLMDNFAANLAELIHTTPYANDTGFYVQYGHRASFDRSTRSAHLSHVHVAMSGLSAQRILAQLGAPTGRPVGSRPDRQEVWGWDASNWDWQRGPMDLAAARSAGINFFVHKATEGVNFKDPYYRQAMERARAARMPVMGAYHGLWPDNPISDARAFFEHVQRETPWWHEVAWIWQGDFEKFGRREPSRAEAIAFLDELKRLTGGRGYLIGYVPRWLYGNSFDPFPYDIWASDYTGSGASRPFHEQYQGIPSASWNAYSGRQPRILQFASDAVTGIQPKTCADRFGGSLSELVSLTTNAAPPPAAEAPEFARHNGHAAKRPLGTDPAPARRRAMAAAGAKHAHDKVPTEAGAEA